MRERERSAFRDGRAREIDRDERESHAFRSALREREER